MRSILTIYWPQVTLVFAIISYFFNRYFNLTDKRFELKNSLFEQERIKAIDLFIDKYIEMEFVFTQLNYRDALSFKMSSKELDLIVFPTYNQFTSAYYKLFFLLDESEITDFSKLYDSIGHVKRTLGDLRHSYSDEERDMFNRTEKYVGLAFDTARSNKTILKNIGRRFRKSYLK